MKKFIRIFVFAFICFVLLIGVGTYIFSSISKGQMFQTKSVPGDQDRVNILILGVDAKDKKNSQGARTDTMMVASFNPVTKAVHIVSIPRDTRVAINGRKGLDKINHAHAYGGTDLAIRTVEDFLDININFFVKIDYKGLAKVVDDVGGVEVDVPMDMKYNDPYADPPLKIDLKKGKQILNSDEALQFVRFRKGYSDQDLGRINAQHTFLTALADKLLGPKTLLILPKLLETFTTYVETDIPASAITTYGMKAASVRMENIHMITIPGEPKLINNIWYYVPNEEATKAALSEIMKDNTLQVSNSINIDNNNDVTVEVLNGSGIGGLAAETANRLKEMGYHIVNVDNVKGIEYSETHIYDRKNREEDAKKIAKLLGTKKYEQDIRPDAKADITVIVGSNLKN